VLENYMIPTLPPGTAPEVIVKPLGFDTIGAPLAPIAATQPTTDVVDAVLTAFEALTGVDALGRVDLA
jgi:hypothetical protein